MAMYGSVHEFVQLANTSAGGSDIASLEAWLSSGAQDAALESECTPDSRRRCAPVLCTAKRGTKRVLKYPRLAMGFANVRASRYGIR